MNVETYQLKVTYLKMLPAFKAMELYNITYTFCLFGRKYLMPK